MYKDPIVEKYINLIKSYRDDIKTYYNGVKTEIGQSECPSIMIDVNRLEAQKFSNTEDQHRVSLNLTLVTDIRSNFQDTARIDAGINKVLEILVGRKDDYSLKEKSILNILRKNVNVDTSNQLRTDVGSITVVSPREVGIGRQEKYWSTEGTIGFEAHFIQER